MLTTTPRPTTSENNASSTRACQNCSRAKAKCLPSSSLGRVGVAKCARCERLGKECATVPRAVRRRRVGVGSSTAQLEQKLESLVSLLSAQGIPTKPHHLSPPESHISSAPSPSSPFSPSSDFPTSDQRWSGTYPKGWIAGQPQQLIVGGTDLFPPCINTGLSTIYQQEPYCATPAPIPDAERLIEIFKTHWSPHFPFVALPEGLTTDELRTQRPWLYRVVVMIASDGDRLRQVNMSKRMLMDVSASMLIRGEKSLDLLQCLILYNIWLYYYSPVIPSLHSTGIHQLTLGLLFDLTYHKPFQSSDGPMHDLAAATSAPDKGQRTSDERRALLACYFITSISAFCFKKLEGLRYSAYMEYTCTILEEAQEHQSDLLLVSLVRLQNIIEPVNRLFLDKMRVDESSVPVWMVVKLVQTELESLWTSLPPSIQQDSLMLMTYHSALVFTHEPSLHKSFFPSSSIHRLDMLYSCLLSCQTLLNAYVSRPLSTFSGITTIDLAHMGRGLSILLKLSLLDEPGWDLPHIRQTVDLSYYFTELSGRFARLGEELDGRQKSSSEGGRESYSHPTGSGKAANMMHDSVERPHSFPTGCSKAMKMVQTWYEARLAAEKSAVNEGIEDIAGEGNGLEDVFGGEGFDYLNDANWFDFMADTNIMPMAQ